MPLHLPFDPFHGRHPPAPSEETSCSTCSGWPSIRTPPARPRKSRWWRWTIRGTRHVRRHSPGFLGRCDGTDSSIRPRKTRDCLRARELRERRRRSVLSSRPRKKGGRRWDFLGRSETMASFLGHGRDRRVSCAVHVVEPRAKEHDTRQMKVEREMVACFHGSWCVEEEENRMDRTRGWTSVS